MSLRFRLLTEADVKSVVTMDDLIETMASALKSFSAREVEQPVRTVIVMDRDAFYGTMPALVRGANAAMGAKLVTVAGWDTISDSVNPRKPLVGSSDARRPS